MLLVEDPKTLSFENLSRKFKCYFCLVQYSGKQYGHTEGMTEEQVDLSFIRGSVGDLQ